MGSMTCIGSKRVFNSYRSELMELVGASITLRTLASCVDQPKCLILGCDGQAALSSIGQTSELITSNIQHWDLISTLHDIWNSMMAAPLLTHVRGHQDAIHNNLSRLEHMNILMDKLAKSTALCFPPRDPEWTIANIGIPPVTIHGKVVYLSQMTTLLLISPQNITLTHQQYTGNPLLHPDQKS